MEFLNPTALYGLFLLPALLIPYLIKGKPRRLLFSSLVLFYEFSPKSAQKPWSRLYLPPLFFLQLLLLFLLLFSLSEPVFSFRPSSVAVVLDNSASLQAVEGGTTRFDLAKKEARTILGGLPLRSTVDLYRTTPNFRRLGEAALSVEQAGALLSSIETYDLGEATGDYGQALDGLLKEKDYERIYFVTDHPAERQSDRVRIVPIGKENDNLALTGLDVRRPSLASSGLDAAVEIQSFSARDKKIRVTLKGDGRPLSSKNASVEAGKKIEISFDGVPSHRIYESVIETEDAFPLDNHRFVVPESQGALDVLALSPRPEAVKSLASLPGVRLRLAAPKDYENEKLPESDLLVFHYAAPAELPKHDAIFILPPKDNRFAAQGKSLTRPAISNWQEPHRLTRYVNFALFRPGYARPLKPLSGGQIVVEAPEGPLAFFFEQEGYRYLFLGFDLFPYLGRENLPMSIFTINILEWFLEGSPHSGHLTGEPLRLTPSAGLTVADPTGRSSKVKENRGFYSETFYQGIYRVSHGGQTEAVAVNFEDQRESDLLHPIPIALKGEALKAEKKSTLFSFWPYLLLASLLLFYLEWFFSESRRNLRSANFRFST